MVTSSRAHPRGWSASATVPVMAPEATCDRKRWHCSGLPTSRTIGANWVTVARRGPGARPGPAPPDNGHLDERRGRCRLRLRGWRGRANRARPWNPRASRVPRPSPRPHGRARPGTPFPGTNGPRRGALPARSVNSSSTASLPGMPVTLRSRCRDGCTRQIGASVPDAHVSLPAPVLPSRRSVFWEAGHRVPRGVAGPRREPGPAISGATGHAMARTAPVASGDGTRLHSPVRL